MESHGTDSVPPDEETRQGYPFSFRCRRSGNCCAIPGGVVQVSAEELAAIAGFLGLTPEAVRSRYLQPGRDVLLDEPGTSRCVFLEQGMPAGCRIHPVRPGQCREWPFWPGLRSDPELLRKAFRMCPGMRPLAAH